MGLKFIAQGDPEKAYFYLNGCQDKSDASDAALYYLGTLYTQFNYGNFESDADRIQVIYSLFYRSAILGNHDAITELAGLYESGEPLLSIDADSKRYECLNKISEYPTEDYQARIKECIGDVSIFDHK